MRKLIFAVMGIVGLIGAAAVMADDDDGRRHGRGLTAATTDSLYVRECGSCHLAYPARWLPARSWQRLLGGLDEHFGDNAELGPQERATIENYLTRNAADSSGNRTSKVMRSMRPDDVPLRITETEYFRHKHHEIPARAIRDNPDVRSLAQCQACHPRAETGSYEEHEVAIPGFGRWESD